MRAKSNNPASYTVPTLPTDVEVLDGRVLFARPERAKAAQ